MMKTSPLLDTILAAITVSALTRLVLQTLLGGIVKWAFREVSATTLQFWVHAHAWAIGHHKTRHPLECEDCRVVFYDLPD